MAFDRQLLQVSHADAAYCLPYVVRLVATYVKCSQLHTEESYLCQGV